MTGQTGEKDNGAGVLLPGEKLFSLLLFLAGLFFFAQSLILLESVSPPRISSAAALPVFVTGVWTALSLATVIANLRRKSPHGKGAMRFAFPKTVTLMLAAIAAYCAAMTLGAGFYVATPLFLWGSMCGLSRGGYAKNALWTAVCMAFIALVFRTLFGVVLP